MISYSQLWSKLFVVLFVTLIVFNNTYANDFQKGFSYMKWGEEFQTQSAYELSELKKLGTSHVSIIPLWYQDGKHETTIYPHPVLSPSRDAIKTAISKAQQNGLKVLYKPHIDVIEDFWINNRNNKQEWLNSYDQFQESYPIPRPFNNVSPRRDYVSWFDQLFPSWRGNIAPNNIFFKKGWLKKWFRGYRHFIFWHASIAKEMGVQLFCLGTEFKDLEQYDSYWKSLIRELKDYFRGTNIKLFYNANHNSYQDVSFWDDLDFIGISAYFPLTTSSYSKVEDLEDGLRDHLNELNNWRRSHYPNKQILFSEIGYSSLGGSSKTPWDFKQFTYENEQEQADSIEAALNEIARHSWIKGVYFWRWTTQQNSPRFNYDYFTPYGKKAEQVFKEKWGN